MTTTRPTLPALLLTVAACAWTPNVVSSPTDSQRALAARQSGQIMPLDALLRDIERQIDGRLLQAEFDDDGALRVYEIRWQMKDGRRLELEIDARTGAWLSLEGRRLETIWRGRP